MRTDVARISMEAHKVRSGYRPNFRYLRTLVGGAAALWLAAFSADTPAQSAPRPFQMSILSSTDNVYNAGVDLPTFSRNVFYNYQSQPKGSSIAWLPPDRNLDRHNINWKHIVAVYVDEPYSTYLDRRSSCDDPAIRQTVIDLMAELQAMAAALRTKAPRARFWVNFSKNDVNLMKDPGANCALNQPYIDVISLDWYGRNFFYDILNLYEYLYHNRATPYQQLALVPGTFTGPENHTGDNAREWLQSHFDYATLMNSVCNLPHGPTGKTGYYDGCPVWMVAGWMGGVIPYEEKSGNKSSFYYPIDHPSSIKVFETWQEQFAMPPTRQPVNPMRKLMPLLFEQ